MPLVDYSDSEGDDDDDEQPQAQPQPQPAPQPQPQPAPAPEQPPAKKQKKEINLQSLLQKHDAALPFEEANSLPSDFFDSDRVREPDAGETSNAQPAARGWAALSSLLPAPKNAPKPGAKSADPSALFRNAKPLKKPGNGSSSTAGGSSSTAALPPPTTTSLPLVADDDGDEDDDDNDASGGLLPRQSALAAPSLMPKINVGMYDTTADDAAAQPQQDDSSLMYAAPVGPAMGPMDAAAEDAYGGGAAYGSHAGYAEPPPYDFDGAQVVDVNADAMLKAMGPAKQYEFAAPPPPSEVKIAASTWNRATGQTEVTYKASSTSKRKHQINSLAAEAAARSAEISMRGAKGMKSKKETAAKYGW